MTIWENVKNGFQSRPKTEDVKNFTYILLICQMLDINNKSGGKQAQLITMHTEDFQTMNVQSEG